MTASKFTRAWLLDRATWLVLAVLPVALYAQVWNFEFLTYDDQIYVTSNRHVDMGLSWESIRWSFTTLHAEFYHPLTWLTLMLDREIYFEHAGGYHFTNVLLHLGNTLWLFAALRRMTGAHWRSAMVAALFAVHPLHVESVAWVAERKDVLSTFFGFMALYCYARYTEGIERKWYLATLGAFACSLLSKSTFVTFPCLVLVLDWWPLRRFGWSDNQEGPSAGTLAGQTGITRTPVSWRRLLIEKVPLLLLAMLSSLLTMKAQRPEDGIVLHQFAEFGPRLLNAILVYSLYLKHMVWPQDLACFYPHPEEHINRLLVALSGVFLLAVTLIGWWQRRRRPYLLSGWLWYLGVLFPVIGVVPISGFQMADRYTYISLNGVVIALVWLAADLLPRTRAAAWVAAVGSAALLAILCVVSWNQIRYWRNTEVLFDHALQVTEPNVMTYNLAGLAYINAGNYEQAEKYLLDAVKIRESYFPTYEYLSTLELQRGNVEASINWLKRGIEIEPAWASFHFRIAMMRFDSGEYEDAVKWLDQGAELSRGFATRIARSGWGVTAIDKLRQRPEDPQAHVLIAGILRNQGQRDKALAEVKQALALSPNLPAALAEQKKIEQTDFSEFPKDHFKDLVPLPGPDGL